MEFFVYSDLSELVKRIDQDKLTEVIYGAPEPFKGAMKHFAWLDAASIAATVPDELPDLMKGEER